MRNKATKTKNSLNMCNMKNKSKSYKIERKVRSHFAKTEREREILCWCRSRNISVKTVRNQSVNDICRRHRFAFIFAASVNKLYLFIPFKTGLKSSWSHIVFNPSVTYLTKKYFNLDLWNLRNYYSLRFQVYSRWVKATFAVTISALLLSLGTCLVEQW